jgi:CHAD domain-containing protein
MPKNIFLSLLDKLKSHASRILSSNDPEDLHQARVASRRLRLALSAFGKHLPRKLKPLRKDLKKFTKALGKARDLDIQLAFLNDLKAQPHSAEITAGLEKISLRLEENRRIKQENIIKALKQLGDKNIFKNLEKHVPEINVKNDLKKIAKKQISKRLDELLGLEKYAYQPKAAKKLHKLRIAAKHLRYALELFAPIYSKKLEPYTEISHTAQNFLGDIHDMDIWLETLPKIAKKKPSLKIAAIFLENTCRIKRQVIYKDFLTFWEKIEKDSIWKNLKDII